MQLTLNFAENATPKEIAASLRMRAGIFEGLTSKEAASNKNTQTPAMDEDDDFETPSAAPAKATKSTQTKKAAAAAFDDDEETATEASSDFDFDEDVEEPKAKKTAATTAKAKTKKAATLDDVNDACKSKSKELTLAGEDGRAMVKKVLKKQFKVASVQELEASQYAEVIKAVNALGLD